MTALPNLRKASSAKQCTLLGAIYQRLFFQMDKPQGKTAPAHSARSANFVQTTATLSSIEVSGHT